MLIQSSQQMQQIRDSGGHIRLNSQGQLVTQSRISHFLQRLVDAFRSLSASGREAIIARNKARDDAMRALADRDAMSNPVRTKLPRTTMSVVTPSRSASLQAPDLERLQGDMRTLVQREVARRFAHMSEQDRAVIVDTVMQDLRELPELAQVSRDPAHCLDENVREAVRQYTGDIGTQAPVTGQTSATRATPQAHGFQAQIRTLVEDILQQAYPRLDRQRRDALIQGAVLQFQNLEDVFDQANSDMQRSLVHSYLKEAIGGTPPSTSADSRFHCFRTLATEQDIRPDTIVRQGNNTCFMLSVINSMMTTPKGRQILKDSLLPGGRLWDVLKQHPEAAANVSEPSFSELERLLAVAYQPKDPQWKAGQIGIAVDFASLFGMKSACYNFPHEPQTAEEMKNAEFQVQLPRPNAVETIRQRLAEGKMVLVRQNMHYRAVVGTDGDRLILRNSLGQGREESVPVHALDGAELDVLAYPED